MITVIRNLCILLAYLLTNDSNNISNESYSVYVQICNKIRSIKQETRKYINKTNIKTFNVQKMHGKHVFISKLN